MSAPTGWYADTEPRHPNDLREPLGDYRWQPVLQTAEGTVSLERWYATKADCDAFIRDHVLGEVMIDD